MARRPQKHASRAEALLIKFTPTENPSIPSIRPMSLWPPREWKWEWETQTFPELCSFPVI